MFRFLTLLTLSITVYGRPLWIDNPNYSSNYIGGVGFCRDSSYRCRRVAEMFGRAEISEALSVKVDSTYTSSTDGGTEHSSIHSSKNLIKGSYVKSEWVDPESGKLYLWIVIEK
jgi:hypothetical protein